MRDLTYTRNVFPHNTATILLEGGRIRLELGRNYLIKTIWDGEDRPHGTPRLVTSVVERSSGNYVNTEYLVGPNDSIMSQIAIRDIVDVEKC